MDEAEISMPQKSDSSEWRNSYFVVLPVLHGLSYIMFV